jgi:hypothetical protein
LARHDQAQVGLGQFFLGAPALVLGGGDDFDRTPKFLAVGLDPPLDRLHGALRFVDAGGDVEQVLADAVDLEHVAAILRLGRLLDQLVFGAAGGVLIVLNDLMGLGGIARADGASRR